MKIWKQIALSMAMAAVTAVMMADRLAAPVPTSPVAASSLDRILRTHEIRCGYVNYPPLLSKDPNTGDFRGIGVDIMKRVADMLHASLVWSEETSWAHYIEGLESGRFDALCTLDFFPQEYVGRVGVTRPLFYTGIGVYKRVDDVRFQPGDTNFDNPQITISALDGSISMLIKNTSYPKAKLLSMPALTDYSAILMNVATGKADVAFVERAAANEYLKHNPGKLVNLAENKPLRVYPYFVPFRFGDVRLKEALDEAVQTLTLDGEIDGIVDRYESGTPSFYKVTKNYQ
jgi:polar amino acid transport system substrate-binding protein